VQEVQDKVANRQYDVILMNTNSWLKIDSLMIENYDVTDTLVLDMPQYYNLSYTVLVAKPKP
jgi:hypothetical protein